jgi:putative flippase GtrA
MKKTIEELFVFGKAQVSAFFGGIVDYLLMIFFTEVFGIHYTISTGIGGVIGAYINFSLNRRWTFITKGLNYRSSWFSQISKFVVVVLNSILLKSTGTYFFTTYFFIDYKISRIIANLLVSLIFNYTLQKHWVFRKEKRSPLAQESADSTFAEDTVDEKAQSPQS